MCNFTGLAATVLQCASICSGWWLTMLQQRVESQGSMHATTTSVDTLLTGLSGSSMEIRRYPWTSICVCNRYTKHAADRVASQNTNCICNLSNRFVRFLQV